MDKYFWREEEIGFLQKNYSKISNKEISIKLGRSEDSVRVKASNLGLSFQELLKKKCLNCEKEFTTKIKTKAYCSAKCRCKQATIRQQEVFKKNKQKIYKKRAEKRKQLKIQREELIAANKNKNSLNAFFELYCLSVNTYEGIRKIEQFTKSKDAERIYKVLRYEFMHSKNF